MRENIVLLLLIVFTIVVILIYYYAPKFIIEVKNPIIIALKRGIYKEKTYKKRYNPTQQITIETTNDHLKLRILKLRINVYTTPKAKATIILVHGIRSSKEVWDFIARWLNQNDYNAVVPDLRGHGQSQGIYCTFGYKEKDDINDIVKFLEQNNFQKPFGIWGHSLGGATSLQVLASNKKITFGIIEGSYAKFSEVVQSYSRYYLGFTSKLLNNIILRQAAKKAHFSLKMIDPIDYVSRISQPILFIYGEKDKKVNPRDGELLFSKTKSTNELPRCKHRGIF